MIHARIDGRSFTIHIREKACCSCNVKRVIEAVYEDDSESDWSVENENSDGPTAATLLGNDRKIRVSSAMIIITLVRFGQW